MNSGLITLLFIKKRFHWITSALIVHAISTLKIPRRQIAIITAIVTVSNWPVNETMKFNIFIEKFSIKNNDPLRDYRRFTFESLSARERG